MRGTVILGLLGIGLWTGAPGARGQGTRLKPPADFPLAKAEGSPGQVTFSHEKHLTKVGRCSACHMKDFKLKRGGSGPITMAAMQEGNLCGACHDGKRTIGGAVVFSIDQCDSCHKD